jgi:TolB-like protein
LRAEQLRLGRLPIVECVRIGRLLASALAHLHRHNLVHRDVKPSNIIFVEGQPKLADIGLVADVSEARSFVGTEGFIPPEGPGTPQADPARRYASAEAMELDLALLERGHSVRRRRSRQHRWAIALFATLAAAGLSQLGPWLATGEWSRGADRASIFVLPFRHSAPGPVRAESWEIESDVCLCGRLTDAFIDALPLIPGIRTGPRKSGWIRHDEDQVRRELVRTNDTRYILTGRVDHTNDVLRLVLRLYARQQETPLWTGTFTASTNDVVTLERQAIAAVADRLELSIPEAAWPQIGLTLSNNLAAYTSFHGARSRYLLGSFANLHQALADYTAALDADHRYTAALVGLMWLRGEIGFEQPPRTVQPEIYNRARQLLALDDTVFLAHTRIASRRLCYDYDWEGALQYIDWMRSVWPEDNLETAIWMRALGRTNEARIYHERLKQQPNPGLIELHFIAYGECAWRQYDAALAAAERARALYPESSWSLFLLGQVHLVAGHHLEAIDCLKEVAGPGPGPQLLGLLGRAYALAGDRATATALLRQLEMAVGIPSQCIRANERQLVKLNF